MKTFNEKLEQEQEKFDLLKKEYKAYEKKAMPEVLEYLKQYRKEKNKADDMTVYNSELIEYIQKKENVSENLKRHLETEIYLAQHDFQDEKDKEHKDKMLSLGYLELTKDTEYRGKIILNAICEGYWATHKIDEQVTLITDCNGNLFIIAKGKKKRGWYLHSLKRAFYKPVLK